MEHGARQLHESLRRHIQNGHVKAARRTRKIAFSSMWHPESKIIPFDLLSRIPTASICEPDGEGSAPLIWKI